MASTLKSQRGKDGGGIGPEETLIAAQFVGNDFSTGKNVCPSLRAGADRQNTTPMVFPGSSVRRLTPRECERLQALPDDWTLVNGAADSRRYAALGDAVTASVAEWIGARILNARVPA